MSRVRRESEQEFEAEVRVIEEPPDPLFPRRPNVVSHRRHMVRVEVIVHRVPEGTTHLNLRADVIAYDPPVLGQEQDVFHSIRIWGSNEEPQEIDPDDLPRPFSIVVERDPSSDHLGQGPYDAFVTVSPTGEELREDTGAGTESFSRGDSEPAVVPVVTDRTFVVRFTSM